MHTQHISFHNLLHYMSILMKLLQVRQTALLM